MNRFVDVLERDHVDAKALLEHGQTPADQVGHLLDELIVQRLVVLARLDQVVLILKIHKQYIH